jgi:N-carbamoylputrescine amidase
VTSVGIVQIGAAGSPEESRARSVDAARGAFERGASLVVLPELIVPGYDLRPEMVVAHAEPVDGDTVTAWADLAREAGGYVVGGFAERDGDAVYNTAVLVGPRGLELHYRKLHLFAGEKGVFTPGDRGLPVADTELGRLGLCVCYDIRFVETLRAFALRGTGLVCVPTAWLPGFDSERWDADGFCPQARVVLMQANLNQLFVACASQPGLPSQPRFLGSSIVADPRGASVLGPLPGDAEEVALVDVDLDAVTASMDRGDGILPREDRRTDVYRLAIDGELL